MDKMYKWSNIHCWLFYNVMPRVIWIILTLVCKLSTSIIIAVNLKRMTKSRFTLVSILLGLNSKEIIEKSD